MKGFNDEGLKRRAWAPFQPFLVFRPVKSCGVCSHLDKKRCRGSAWLSAAASWSARVLSRTRLADLVRDQTSRPFASRSQRERRRTAALHDLRTPQRCFRPWIVRTIPRGQSLRIGDHFQTPTTPFGVPASGGSVSRSRRGNEANLPGANREVQHFRTIGTHQHTPFMICGDPVPDAEEELNLKAGNQEGENNQDTKTERLRRLNLRPWP